MTKHYHQTVLSYVRAIDDTVVVIYSIYSSESNSFDQGALLTNNKTLAKESVVFLYENAEEILFDFETLAKAVETGIKTKASGFDNLYLAVTDITNSTLLTDDLQLHKLAKKVNLKSKLLRKIA